MTAETNTGAPTSVFIVLFNDSPRHAANLGCTEVRGVAFALDDALLIVEGSETLRNEVAREHIWIEEFPVGADIKPGMMLSLYPATWIKSHMEVA